MNKTRLEAFSDAVIAIVMTIMVLELKVPHAADFEALKPLVPIFLSYILSFIYIGIYWNNHHHVFQAAKQVRGSVLWANTHLMFWLSLIPFVTAWAGENHFSEGPVALYGFVLLMNGVAFQILVRVLLKDPANHVILKEAMGQDVKGWISPALYAVAISVAFWMPLVSCAIYIVVAVIWFIPDRRIESRMVKNA